MTTSGKLMSDGVSNLLANRRPLIPNLGVTLDETTETPIEAVAITRGICAILTELVVVDRESSAVMHGRRHLAQHVLSRSCEHGALRRVLHLRKSSRSYLSNMKAM